MEVIKVSKISNVINMLQILSSGRKYSINELANTLEVTPRMIRVYKEELENALKSVDKQVYGLNSDLKNLNQALKLDPKNTELLSVI